MRSTPRTPPAWQAVATELVATRGDALQRYAYLLCGSRDDAADLVQDGLVRTFSRARDDFSLAGAEGYVRRAILSAYLDGGRRASKWRSILHLAARTDSADSPTAATDSRLDLHGELSRLSRRERACVVLRYYEDLPVDDIADRLGLSSGTVKRYLSDGLRKLSASLGAASTSSSTPTSSAAAGPR
ncbi:MAG: sigma-70 family polymerase sigma factor [Naasia sp.]|nr:sigma-70 family polymerase sigma factor [Naasia sp.]